MERKMDGATRFGGGIGRVLGELDDDAVAVVAAGVVLFGIGVFPEAGGIILPGLQGFAPQLPSIEGVDWGHGSRSRSTVSTAFSSRACSGGAGVGRRSVSVSEGAPHPWSIETTLPSEGDHSLVQAPNTPRSEPAKGVKNPQEPQARLAAIAWGERGPCSPSYQRWAASVRPSGERTRGRPRPISHIAIRSTSSSPVASKPGSRRGSSLT